jgi:type II secretory pathway predicted ATPase ExeA
LSVAGGNAWIFDDAAVAEIHRYTGGVARLINNLGDLALYLGMSENAVRVDASIVGRIIADIDKSTGKRGVE